MIAGTVNIENDRPRIIGRDGFDMIGVRSISVKDGVAHVVIVCNASGVPDCDYDLTVRPVVERHRDNA